jgi:hypothetical protein
MRVVCIALRKRAGNGDNEWLKYPKLARTHRIEKSGVDELQIRPALLKLGRSDEFLEARIIPERIKHRIQP